MHPGKKAFVIGEVGLKNELRAAGVQVLGSEGDKITMSDKELEEYQCDSCVQTLVVGIDFNFSFRKLSEASLYLQNGCDFITANKDRTSGNQDRMIPACGTVVKMIEVASGQKAETAGKPSRFAFDLIREQHGLEDVPLSKFLMVGDNLETDIKFGSNCGIDTLLVLSGCTSEQKALEVLNNDQLSAAEAKPTHVQP